VRVLILSNRRSGRGRAEGVCRAAIDALVRAGHDAAPMPPAESDPLASAPDAVVVAGGDGSVHHLLPALAESGIPVYHLPLGTANLFARQFGMTRSKGALVRALAAMRTTDIDLIEFNGRPAAVMLSLGPDASVVHRLARVRTGPIRLGSYVAPFVAELRDWSPGVVSVEADGRGVVERGAGVLVVANMRHYGGRFDPAPGADPGDGLLDVVFLPAPGAGAFVRLAALSRLGRHLCRPGVVHARAREVRIEAGATPAQADGEAVGHPGRIDVVVRPRALRVLLPG